MATDDPLAGLRWDRRVLIVAAPAVDDPALGQQRAILAEQVAGLLERDMVVIEIVGDRATIDRERTFDGEILRRRLGLAAGAFAIRLLGKDGGTKLMSASPVATERLFALIDAMPMRRREMRERRP